MIRVSKAGAVAIVDLSMKCQTKRKLVATEVLRLD